MTNSDWLTQAECAKPENRGLNWFPKAGESTKRQLKVCAVCPVQAQCAADGKGDMHGIRAGKAPRRSAYCGTLSGRAVHKRLGEPTCEDCRIAQVEATLRSRARKKAKAL